MKMITTTQLEAINAAIKSLAQDREKKYTQADYNGADYIQHQIAILINLSDEYEAHKIPSAFDAIDFDNINLDLI
jgi:hypothetical protein